MVLEILASLSFSLLRTAENTETKQEKVRGKKFLQHRQQKFNLKKILLCLENQNIKGANVEVKAWTVDM